MCSSSVCEIPCGTPRVNTTMPCQGMFLCVIAHRSAYPLLPGSMHLWRQNSYTMIHGAPQWFLEHLGMHLSVPVEMGTPPGQRFGRVYKHREDWWGSLLLGNRVASGLTDRVLSIANYYSQQGYHLPVDIHDKRQAPPDCYPWHSLTANFRPYQDWVHEAVMRSDGAGVIDVPPRGGKTLMAARIVDSYAQPTIILAPSLAIVRQTYHTLVEIFGTELVARVDGETKKADRDISKPIVIATVQSAVKLSREFWDTRGMLIIDEFHHCCSFATQVLTADGLRAIGDLRVGDRIWSSGSSGLELRSVLRKWVRPAPAKLLKITTSVGVLEVTDEHDIYTPDGKVRSGDLREGSEVRVLKLRGCTCGAGTQRQTLRALLGGEPQGESQASDGEALRKCGVPEASIRTDVGEEQNAQQGIARADDGGVQESDRGGPRSPLRQGCGRQGLRAECIGKTGGDSLGPAGICSRACGEDRAQKGLRQCDLVQSGLGQPCSEDCRGDRRHIPSEPAGVGRPEGCVVAGQRLGSAACTCGVNPGSAAVVTGRVLSIETIEAPGAKVYDLEVEGNHNYFAEGVLVSNSASDTYHLINDLATNVYYRFCLTGTHWRTGEDGLAMEAICSRVLAKVPLSYLVQHKYLCEPYVHFVPFRAPPFPAGDWMEAHQLGIIDCEARNEIVASYANQLAEHSSGIVLTSRRAHADHLGERISESEVVKGGAGALTGKSIDRFKAGAYQVLVGTSVIGEGVDLPNAWWLIYAGGLGGSVQMMQSYFRPFTASPETGKTHGRVYDFRDLHHPTLQRQSESRIRLAENHLGAWLHAPLAV